MIRYIFSLLLCFILAGGIYVSPSGDLRIGDSLNAQSKKKKKTSSKKRKSSKKKRSSKKKAQAAKPESTKQLPIVNKGPQINVAAYADELFHLSSELDASNKEMAKATRYIYNEKPVSYTHLTLPTKA